MVGFRVGSETYAVPIALVHEIVRVPDIAALPEAPSWVEGVMNLRGKIIPVIDFRKRFGEKEPRSGPKNRVIVAEIEGRKLGLIVDAASEVFKLAADDVEPPPPVFQETDVNYVTGVGKLKGQLIILIELAKVLEKGELRRLSELAPDVS